MKTVVMLAGIIMVAVVNLVMTVNSSANRLDNQTMGKLVGGACYWSDSKNAPSCTPTGYICRTSDWYGGTVVHNFGRQYCKKVTTGRRKCWSSGRRKECLERTYSTVGSCSKYQDSVTYSVKKVTGSQKCP